MFEKLLSLIERGVVALEKLAVPVVTAAGAAAVAAAKPAKVTKPTRAPEPEADPFADAPAAEKEYTRQEVRDALVAYSQKEGQSQATAVALVAKVGGVEKFSDLPKEKFAAVFKAATA